MSGPTSFETAAGSAVFGATAISIAIWDKNRQIIGANATFERDLGVEGGSLGLSLEAIVAPEVCGNFATLLEEIAQSQGSVVLELPCLRGKTRVPFVVVVVGAHALSEGGICIFVDAKSRGAWLAHEINNSLAYAMGNLSFAIESLEVITESLTPRLTSVLLALRDALEGAERVRQTIRDLKTLPSSQEHRTARAALPVDTSRRESKGVKRARVLVVDDEPHMGTAIARILSPMHDVTAVYSARDAMAKLDNEESFDVILCDIMMPQMGGDDLYRELAKISPRLASRVVFMTGGPFSLRGLTFLEDLPNIQLEKPFTPAMLREVIRRAVA